MKFCVGKQNSSAIELMRNCKFWKFKMERPPSWKSLNRKIATKNYPILMKFCTQQLMAVMRDQIWIFYNRWRMVAILKIVLAITQQATVCHFSEILSGEAVFSQQWERYGLTSFHRTYFLHINADLEKNMSTTMAVIDVRPTYWQYFFLTMIKL